MIYIIIKGRSGRLHVAECFSYERDEYNLAIRHLFYNKEEAENTLSDIKDLLIENMRTSRNQNDQG